MSTIFKLPEVFRDDAERFLEQTERFKSGEISSPEFRSFRVPWGVYEQREADTYMLRVRFPAGGVMPDQLRTLAKAARAYGDGVLHVTSRQDIQIHRVLVDDIHKAFRDLWAAGLSTRGGGGNTVRNITGCHDAGVCTGEVFDPSPHALALTEFLLPDPLSYELPRKYKLAFAGCSGDCPGVAINDLGFVAKKQNGAAGFAVYVGGGMGAISRVGELLEEFVPAEEIHYVAEAVKRVFDKHGNRKNRHRARLRFLLDKVGLDGFRQWYEPELAELKSSDLPPLTFREMPGCRPLRATESAEPIEGFANWRRRNVTSQRQDGYHLVQIPLELGDIPAETLEKLADVIEPYGEGMARTTLAQNLVVRWIHENELAGLHAQLVGLGLAGEDPPVLRNMVACTGASTCKLGICLSRGLATAVRQKISDAGVDLDALGELKVHISGCPNSCGRHPVGDIGVFGAARRVKGRLVPHYVLQLGGKVAEGETRLAEGKRAVPARNVPAVMAELLAAFGKSSQCPDFEAFLEAEGRDTADQLITKYAEVPDFQEEKNFYFDFGAEEMFSLAGRGAGECGAGVFDLIEVDLDSAAEALGEERLFDATVLASRALLVTRGQQAGSGSEALALFTQHFLDEKIADDSFRGLIQQAQQSGKSFAADRDEVVRFVEAIRKLYDNMDPSLRFTTTGESAAPAPAADETSNIEIDQEADFRGVVCPLNYVKTKMILDQLPGGKVLSVLLDEEGCRNVPESVSKDGHDVLSVVQQGEQWQVLIRKASTP